MKAAQLIEVMAKLDPNKRIKFQNGCGWGKKTMAVNAIVQSGDVYILMWACHPIIVLEDMKLLYNPILVWYNPNLSTAKLVNTYFPDYIPL